MGNVKTVSCDAPEWRDALKNHLIEGSAVELVGFDYNDLDIPFCRALAENYKMRFSFNKNSKTAQFRPRNTDA